MMGMMPWFADPTPNQFERDAIHNSSVAVHVTLSSCALDLSKAVNGTRRTVFFFFIIHQIWTQEYDLVLRLYTLAAEALNRPHEEPVSETDVDLASSDELLDESDLFASARDFADAPLPPAPVPASVPIPVHIPTPASTGVPAGPTSAPSDIDTDAIFRHASSVSRAAQFFPSGTLDALTPPDTAFSAAATSGSPGHHALALHLYVHKITVCLHEGATPAETLLSALPPQTFYVQLDELSLCQVVQLDGQSCHYVSLRVDDAVVREFAQLARTASARLSVPSVAILFKLMDRDERLPGLVFLFLCVLCMCLYALYGSAHRTNWISTQQCAWTSEAALTRRTRNSSTIPC